LSSAISAAPKSYCLPKGSRQCANYSTLCYWPPSRTVEGRCHVINVVEMNTFTDGWIMQTKGAKTRRGHGTGLNESIGKNSLRWTKSVNEVQRFSEEKQGSQVKEQDVIDGDVFEACCYPVCLT